MTTYSFRLEFDVPFETPSWDIQLDYIYTPGHPGRGPDMSGPGDPPESPSIETADIRYRKVGDDTWSPMPLDLQSFLGIDDDFLDDLWEILCENAEDEAER